MTFQTRTAFMSSTAHIGFAIQSNYRLFYLDMCHEDRSNTSDFQIRAQLEEHGILTYKFAFTPENSKCTSNFAPENSKDNWMCDLAPFAVVGSNTIIQVADNLDRENHADDAGQYFCPKIKTKV